MRVEAHIKKMKKKRVKGKIEKSSLYSYLRLRQVRYTDVGTLGRHPKSELLLETLGTRQKGKEHLK
jgi:hypothetical protein